MKTTTTRTKKLTSFTIGLLVLGVLASTIGISTIGIQQAEARVNTNPDGNGISGGESFKSEGSTSSGGFGTHFDLDDDGSFINNEGVGTNNDFINGGRGTHVSCDSSSCDTVGSGDKGLHNK